MKKKLLISLLLLAVGSASVFASSKDKLGAYVGWPLGLSYSHEFTDLVELDLIAAYNGWRAGYGGLNIFLGALFTLTDGSVDGHPWALTLGPSLGTQLGFWGGFRATLDILADLRWEIDFATVKGFNFFLDFAPGVSIQFYDAAPMQWFGYRAGVGLRYRFQ